MLLLLNKEKLKSVKKATVAIGLAKKDDHQPVSMYGSGFIVNTEGYIITAAHVFTYCEMGYKYFANRGIETEIAAFHVDRKERELKFNVITAARLKITETLRKEGSGPDDLDIGFIIPTRNDFNVTYLDIKRPTGTGTYDEVVICGYPGGSQSLNLEDKSGLRFSPIIQVGHIVGFMPTDDFQIPWGLQTDIVGTGGSSGSAIVDPSDGKVIGIAQEVLTADITGIFSFFSTCEG